jgi:hypothetical protein
MASSRHKRDYTLVRACSLYVCIQVMRVWCPVGPYPIPYLFPNCPVKEWEVGEKWEAEVRSCS